MAQLELLSVVAEHPGARPGQLARLLHMRPNTVTTIVNALTARGMMSRATADGDRRAIELTVTDAGQQAVHAWQATNAAVLHLALSTLPEPQQRALAAAVPAIDALARAIDRLADTRQPTRTPDETMSPPRPQRQAHPPLTRFSSRDDPAAKARAIAEMLKRAPVRARETRAPQATARIPILHPQRLPEICRRTSPPSRASTAPTAGVDPSPGPDRAASTVRRLASVGPWRRQ